MTSRRIVVLGAAVLPLLSLCSALAAPLPPPPPPTPSTCHLCGGPPAPPSRSTPVPTLAPQAAAPVQVVAVHLTPASVRRGHIAKLAVKASGNDLITIEVVYHSGKPRVLHSKVGDSGSLIESWKVPKYAPVGSARVKVTVAGGKIPYITVLSFTVTR